MKKLNLLLVVFTLVLFSCKKESIDDFKETNFRDLSLSIENSNWNLEKEGVNSFKSDIFTFYHFGSNFSGVWYNSGFFYSNRTTFLDNKTDYQKNPFSSEYQYTSSARKGINDNIYLVYNNLNNQTNTNHSIEFDFPIFIKKIFITNNAYAYCSMKYGDNFAKKFTNSDWFKVIFTVFDEDEKELGKNEFFLAENGNILNDWKEFEFNFTEKIKFINISFDSSDKGDYGMNTPAYFCIGKISYKI